MLAIVFPPADTAGYHVFAPDVRGYGRTTPAPVAYTDDLRPFGSLNKIRDMLALVLAMGYRSVAAVIGHDQGSPLAGWCASRGACAGHDLRRPGEADAATQALSALLPDA